MGGGCSGTTSARARSKVDGGACQGIHTSRAPCTAHLHQCTPATAHQDSGSSDVVRHKRGWGLRDTSSCESCPYSSSRLSGLTERRSHHSPGLDRGWQRQRRRAADHTGTVQHARHGGRVWGGRACDKERRSRGNTTNRSSCNFLRKNSRPARRQEQGPIAHPHSPRARTELVGTPRRPFGRPSCKMVSLPSGVPLWSLGGLELGTPPPRPLLGDPSKKGDVTPAC